MLKRLALFTFLVVGGFGLSGCMGVASPAVGVIYTDTKFGDTATTSATRTKEGKACANSYFMLVATGDASIDAAKAAGGITEVSLVDHTARNVLGIFGEYCTIVKGR